MATQTIPLALLKTWLDIYSNHQLEKLHSIVQEKMNCYYGSVENAEQYYINYLHQQYKIVHIKIA